jgi:hypothetical protein
MQIPEIRQRYLAHVKTIIEDCFNDSVPDDLISETYTLIGDPVLQDPRRLTSYFRFNNEVDTLRKFFSVRKDFIMSHTEIQFESSEISNIIMSVNGVEWAIPSSEDEVKISLSATHPSGIREANLYSASRLYGNFEKRTMEYDGQDFIMYLKNLPGGEYIRFYIEIVADDNQGSVTYAPAGAEHEVYFFRVTAPVLENSDLVINEIMATNNNTMQDEMGEYDDWIELFNKSNSDIDLHDYFLSDDADNLYKWQFPENSTISSNAYLLVWADKDEQQSDFHSNFKLSATGEQLFLVTSKGQIADSLTFTAQHSDISLARLPNGTGDFIPLQPTPGTENLETAISVNLPEQTNGIIIYPNPTHDRLYIKSSRQIIEDITIYDIVGNKVLQTSYNAEVDISQLEAGLYIISIDHISYLIIKN